MVSEAQSLVLVISYFFVSKICSLPNVLIVYFKTQLTLFLFSECLLGLFSHEAKIPFGLLHCPALAVRQGHLTSSGHEIWVKIMTAAYLHPCTIFCAFFCCAYQGRHVLK